MTMGSRMYQYEKIPRIPLEGSASPRGDAVLAFGDFSCTNVAVLSEDGASGIVYEAISEDFYSSKDMPPAKLIVKECYPVEIAEKLRRENGVLSLSPDADEDDVLCFNRFLEQYKGAFSSHAALYQSPAREQIVVPNKSYSQNGTQYLVSDASNGDTMTLAFERMGLEDQIKALVRVCEAITAIHEAGYVYLDLKPDNILCIKNSDTSTSRTYTGEIKLFDFDTATKISDLSKAETLISGSGGWSAHEQTHEGYRDKIGVQSDFYSIGALLFWMAVGRPPKSNEVIHADGRWSISGRDCSNAELIEADERAFQCVRRILNSTLTVDPALRYPTTKPLIDDLSTLGEIIMPVGPTHATDHRAMMAKLDNLTALISQMSPVKEPPRTAPGHESAYEFEDESTGVAINNDSDSDASSDVVQPEAKQNGESPAVMGYAVFQTLTLLANDFEDDLDDDVRTALSGTAADVKGVLSKRNADESEELLETASEMANSATQLLACNMALGMSDNLHIPEKAVSICRSSLSALSQAIVEKDADEMFWRRAEAELCIKAIEPLAAAGLARESLAEYLSESYLAAVDNAVDTLISALADADAERLYSSIKGLENILSRIQDDAIAGMISKQFDNLE